MSTLLALGLTDASTFAPEERTLFFTLVWSSVAVMGLLGVAALFFMIRYRHTAQVDRTRSTSPEWHIEAIWITATTAIFIVVFFWGAGLYREMEIPPAGTTDITVTGRQWMWDVRHSDGRREFDTVHVVVGQPTRLILASEDVIHSFFVPSFRIKQDVLPGKSVTTWFTATKVGSYPIYCAQYCGAAHSQMIGRVIVLSQEAFDAWNRTRTGSDLALVNGRHLYARLGCAQCHEGGAARGPTLAGQYGGLVHLADGTYVQADEAFLHDHLMDLHAPRLAGYPAAMPAYHSLLTEDQAYALVTYLRSLSPGGQATPRS